MKVTYTAFDGTTFNNEEDCLKYEATNKLSKMYNKEGEELALTYDNFCEAWVIFISTQPFMEKCIEWASNCGMFYDSEGMFNNLGWYLYDEASEGWIPIPPAIVAKLFK